MKMKTIEFRKGRYDFVTFHGSNWGKTVSFKATQRLLDLLGVNLNARNVDSFELRISNIKIINQEK